MKKFASYFLLIQTIGLILLNNCMYFYNFSIEQKERNWIKAMQMIPDKEFNVLKVNASLYSFTNDVALEYVNTNIIIGKNTYHVFKRKIKDNILYLYYLKNINSLSKQLKQLASDDNFSDTKSGTNKNLKISVNDYLVDELLLSHIPVFKLSHAINPNSFIKLKLALGFVNLFYPPPKN